MKFLVVEIRQVVMGASSVRHSQPCGLGTLRHQNNAVYLRLFQLQRLLVRSLNIFVFSFSTFGMVQRPMGGLPGWQKLWKLRKLASEQAVGPRNQLQMMTYFASSQLGFLFVVNPMGHILGDPSFAKKLLYWNMMLCFCTSKKQR